MFFSLKSYVLTPDLLLFFLLLFSKMVPFIQYEQGLTLRAHARVKGYSKHSVVCLFSALFNYSIFKHLRVRMVSVKHGAVLRLHQCP